MFGHHGRVVETCGPSVADAFCSSFISGLERVLATRVPGPGISSTSIRPLKSEGSGAFSTLTGVEAGEGTGVKAKSSVAVNATASAAPLGAGDSAASRPCCKASRRAFAASADTVSIELIRGFYRTIREALVVTYKLQVKWPRAVPARWTRSCLPVDRTALAAKYCKTRPVHT